MTAHAVRVALVTGAARGLGRSIAERLAADGAAVGVHYRQSEEAAAQVVAGIQAAGGRAVALRADVRSPDACRALVEQAEATLGPLDTLVCNAGTASGGPIASGDLDGLRETIETNLLGAMYCVSAAVPGMMARRFGRVVALGSPVGTHGGLQGQCAYAASKAGLTGFIKTLANELSPRFDFTANLVSPGVVPTDLTALGLEVMGDRLMEAIPSGRWGHPSEVAAAVAFLVGPEGGYVNGHELAVDGGYSLKYITRRRRNATQ